MLPGRRPQAPQAPLVIFFQNASHGIPAIGEPTGLLDLGSWSIRPTTFGYLAQVPRAPARKGWSSSRATWVVAACLPLLMLPSSAEAAPDKESPSVQRPDGPTAPTLPESDGEGDPEAAPGPEATPPPEGTPEPAAEPEPTSSSGLVDPMIEPAPIGATNTGPDLAVLDAAWEGVDGFDVELELKGHQKMSGRVGAVQRDTFTLIQSKTGAVLVLPKSGVISLRVRTPGPLPAKNGAGLLIGGSILTTVSTPVFISGLTFLGLCPSCTYLHLPMLLVGGGGLAGGIPMLVNGSRQRKAYREVLRERGFVAMALPTRHGWTGGLRFRF